MEKQREMEQPLVISYLDLRKAIGFLGVALPFVVSFGSLFIFRTGLQGSLSGYYYTGMRDWFVGTLWAIGIFLVSYRGYDIRDRIAGRLACVFAICVSLFPTTPEVDPPVSLGVIGFLHFLFAGLFFANLIFFSLFLFVQSDKSKQELIGTNKAKRNTIYRVCGYIMIGCLVLIIAYFLLPFGAKLFLRGIHPVFWLESIAIWAFGFSWLTKGETILKDKVAAIGQFPTTSASEA